MSGRYSSREDFGRIHAPECQLDLIALGKDGNNLV
jgi:hypothetical protein